MRDFKAFTVGCVFTSLLLCLVEGITAQTGEPALPPQDSRVIGTGTLHEISHLLESIWRVEETEIRVNPNGVYHTVIRDFQQAHMGEVIEVTIRVRQKRNLQQIARW